MSEEETDLLDIAAKAGIKSRIIKYNGSEYYAIQLSNPDDFIYASKDPKWDYKTLPIGPGTLGWSRTPYECKDLYNNWMLMEKKAMDKAVNSKSKKKNVLIKMLLVRPSGYFVDHVYEHTEEFHPSSQNYAGSSAELYEILGAKS